MNLRALPLLLSSLFAHACGGGGGGGGELEGASDETETGDEPAPSGLPILGDGTHDLASLEVTIISSDADGLKFPTDLEFKPDVPGELWVTNHQDYSIVVYQHAGLPNQLAMKLQDKLGGTGRSAATPTASLAMSTRSPHTSRSTTTPGSSTPRIHPTPGWFASTPRARRSASP